VRKEPKIYFWDWTKAHEPASRLENLIAVHLLRFVNWLEDVEGVKCELRYFRSSSNHEVDFILLRDRKPWIAVEVKSSEKSLSPSLKYLIERQSIPLAFQISLDSNNHTIKQKVNGCEIHLMPVWKFLMQLP